MKNTIIKIFNDDTSLSYIFKRVYFTIDDTSGYVIPSNIMTRSELINTILSKTDIVIETRKLKFKSLNNEITTLENSKLLLLIFIQENIHYITII